MFRSILRNGFIYILALFSHGAIARAQDPSCDQYDLMVTQTPVPEQTANSLRQHAKLIENVPSDVEVVILGDSILAGWPKDLLADAFPGKRVFNYATGGDRTQNTMWKLAEPKLKKLAPREVLIMIGTNNFGARDKACAISAGIISVIDYVNALWDRPRMTIIGILPRGEKFSYRDTDRRMINGSVSQSAVKRPNVRILNIDEAMTCSTSTNCGNYKSDLVHLNRSGYQTITHEIKSLHQ